MKLLLIDDDLSYRLGLRIWLDNTAEFTIAEEMGSKTEVLDFLRHSTVDMIVIELAIPQGMALCQEVKRSYPSLPIFVLTRLPEPVLGEGLIALGIEGYCPKNIDTITLLAALRRVSTGSTYRWRSSQLPTTLWQLIVNYMQDTGLAQIDRSLVSATQQLTKSNLSRLERWVLAGQKRELQAARWLTEKIWKKAPPTSLVFTDVSNVPLRSLLSRLQENTLAKLDQELENNTDRPIELDILLPTKRKELLYLTKQKVEEQLKQLQLAQITPEQLSYQKKEMVQHLWESVADAFYGTYTTLPDRQNDSQTIAILATLLADRAVVQTEILDRIPLVAELWSALLFQTPLAVDHANWAVDTKEAQIFAEDLFDNLLIQVANAVLQPLINHFSDYEVIKQRYFNLQYRSTREIERFRNELSWQYRYRYLVREPRDIFESKYELLILTRKNIDRMHIYACRNHELRQLSGWQLLITVSLEFQDALAPRLRSVIDFVGRGVVFVLTEVIGRGLGLIGKGIFRGIGYAWQPDGKMRRPSSWD